MAFVDITGVVDADADGIVFEGKPLERPIIPRFIVPKNLARRLAKLTEGDAVEIENQRRAGNVNIEFDENKLRSLLSGIDGKPEQLRDARTARGRVSMRSIRERIPLSDVVVEGTDKDDSDYEELDNLGRGYFWLGIREKLEQKILSMGDWTPIQKNRIERQTYLLVNNLRQMRDVWELMGRRERTGLLRRKTIIDGFESHPDIDLTIEDIVNNSELRIHDDGTISLRLPPNGILRSLLPGDRDYHNTEIPNAGVLQEIVDDLSNNRDAAKWEDLVNSTFQGGNRRNANLAKWPGNGERFPFHDLFMDKYVEQLKTDYSANSQNAIMLRANEISAKLLKYYIIPELEKIARNEDARIGGANKNENEFIHGYLHLLTDPHAWQSIHDELEKRGFVLSPLTVFHDILGHYTLGNTFDRHSEWGNILASLSFARDKDFWNSLRQIPGLEDLTEEDREIYLRATLAEVASNWITRIVRPPTQISNIDLPSQFTREQIEVGFLNYDGPIDEVIDRLDPPDQQVSMRSTRSIRLADASDEDLGKVALDSVEGISVREERLSGGSPARSLPTTRGLLDGRSSRTQRSRRLVTRESPEGRKLAAKAKQEQREALSREVRTRYKRTERNRTLVDLLTRILNSDVVANLTGDDEPRPRSDDGDNWYARTALEKRDDLLRGVISDSAALDNPLATDAGASSIDGLLTIDAIITEYGEKVEPLTPEEQQIVIALRADIKKRLREESTQPLRRRRGGNERSLHFDRITSEEFADSDWGAGWIYPDGSIYPVGFYHGDEHDYEEAFSDGLIRLVATREKTRVNWMLPGRDYEIRTIPGNIVIDYNTTNPPTDEQINAITDLAARIPHASVFIEKDDDAWEITTEQIEKVGVREGITTRPTQSDATSSSTRSMRSSISIDDDPQIQEKRRRIKERQQQAINWKEQRKERGLEENAKLLSILEDIDDRLGDSDDDDEQEIAKTSRILQSLIDEGAMYNNPYVVLGSQRRADLLRLLMEHAPPSPARDTIINDLKDVIKGLDAGSRLRRGANPRPMAMQKMSVDEFAKSFYWGAWMYPDGTLYPVDRHEMEFDYQDAFGDGMVRLMTGLGGELTVDASTITDKQLNTLKKLIKTSNPYHLFVSREQLARSRGIESFAGRRFVGEINITKDTLFEEILRLLEIEDFSDTDEYLPPWHAPTARASEPTSRSTRSTRRVRPKTARKRDIDPEEPLSEKIWDTYEIRRTDDGIHYARDISYQHVRALRNGLIKPPFLPFFAPLGGGNNQRTGEGYYFSVTGRRFYGRYGASGALVRRKRKDGTYEYLLARRSPNMSVGAGKWSFPGGAHRDEIDAMIPGITAVDEFMQEVGGDIRAIEPVYSFSDPMAPDWTYDTYVYEVGPRELRKLRPRDGENTNVEWFTAEEILEMRDNDELLPSFARRAQRIINESGDRSIASARSSRSVVSDDTIPGEPTGVRSARNIKDIDDELSQISKSMANLDARLDAEEITLDEYRKEQIPLRRRSAELGKERAQITGRRRVEARPEEPLEEKPKQPQQGIAPSAGEQTWDSAAFLEQQRQKQIAWMRGLGFSEDEINLLMSPTPTPTSLRSRRTGNSDTKIAPPRFDLKTSPVLTEQVQVAPTTTPNPALASFSDGELIDALEMYNIRIPEKAATPDDSGVTIPSWFPSSDQIILELQTRGYMVTRLRMGDARSTRFTDPMFFAAPNPQALPEQIDRRIPLSSAKLPEFIESETLRTGQQLTTRKGREFKDWKLISNLQSMNDREFNNFGDKLDSDAVEMRRRKASGEMSVEEHDAWLSAHTAIRNTYQDVVAQRRMRALIDAGERLNIDNDPLLKPLDIVFYSQAVPNFRSQRKFDPVVQDMFDDGVIDDSVFNSLANYAQLRQQRDNGVRDGLSRLLGFDIDGERQPQLSPEEMNMVRGLIADYNEMYGTELEKSDLAELDFGQLTALGVDKIDAMFLSGGQPLSMRSRRGKNRKKWNVTGDKKVTSNMKKLTPEQVRLEQEQRRRAKKIPGKKDQGPSKNEWREYRSMKSGRAVGERARYLQDLAANTVGLNYGVAGRPIGSSSPDGQDGYLSFGGDIKLGDILPNNFLSNLDLQGEQRYVVMGISKAKKNSSQVLLRDLKTGSSLSAYVQDDHQLLNVGRSASMRSSRSLLPAVRADILDDFRNLNHEKIKSRVKRLLEENASISAQRDQIEARINEEGELSDEDDLRFGVLDNMLLAVGDEIEEVQSTIEYLLAEQRQDSIDKITREIALSDAKKYTAKDIDKVGLSQDEWQQVSALIQGSPREREILFDLPAGGRASTMSANNLADSLNKIIKEFAKDSNNFTPFYNFDIDEVLSLDDVNDEDEIRAINSAATHMLRHAYVSIQRGKQLLSAKNAIINTTSADITESEVLAIAPTTRSAKRVGRTMGRSSVPTGRGLPDTERLYPGRSEKFADSDVRFINIDGNRGEVIVGKKNGNVIRYGGLTDTEIENFAFGRSSARQALNDIATNARYVVDSGGRARGRVPDLKSLLERDIKRVQLSDNEQKTVKSILDGLVSGANAQAIESVTPEKLHSLVSRLFSNGEPAMATNILDAVDSVGVSTMFKNQIAPLSRRFGSLPQNPIDISLSSDEMGIIRDELARLQQVFQANTNAAAGFKLYDALIEGSQGSGIRSNFSVSPAQFAEILQAYEFAYKQPGLPAMSGFTPLEQAAASPKNKFDTTDMGRISGISSETLFNNGAPMSMGKEEQEKLLAWAQSSNIGIAKEISLSSRLTLNEWNGLQALRNLSPQSMRSSGTSNFTRIDNGAGSPLRQMIPPEYKNMSPVEKLAWINQNSASPDNKKGIRKQDAIDEANNIFSVLSLADSNAEQKQKFESLAYDAPDSRGSLPSFARSWDSLSSSSKDALNFQSQKVYDLDFLELNPLQAVDVIRILRPEANKKKTGPLEINDADINALWQDAITASQKTLEAVSRKLRSGMLLEEEDPQAPVGVERASDGPSSVDNSLASLLSRSSLTKRITESEKRKARTSSTPDNPVAAKQQRQNRANKISEFIAQMDDAIAAGYAARNDDMRHSLIWRDLNKLFESPSPDEGRDLSIGQLDDALSLLDDYLVSDVVADALANRGSGFGPRTNARSKQVVLKNIANAEGIRDGLQKIRESYADDPFIDRTPGRGAKLTQVIEPQRQRPSSAKRNSFNRIPDVEKYFAARRNEQQKPASMRSQKDGRAEIRAEATRFKELMDSLDVEAQKADDARTKQALLMLKQIMRRQKSGLLTDKRTNAGALFLTQRELDEIIEALYVALDRQLGRGGDVRVSLFAEMAELMAKAAMATFVDKTVQPINSRTIKKINEQGDEVEVALYE